MNIQEIRDSRKKAVSVFSKFCYDRENHKDCIFCFFEGEDVKYYGSRIEKYTNYECEKIINYNCGGRKEVLKAHKLICEKPEYDKVNVMFFVDRDFFPLDEVKENVFQTPCYSIENFYTSSECFGRFIIREFGINAVDEDYKMCLSDYLDRQSEFHRETMFLNTWISCQRELETQFNENRLSLSNFNISRLFSKISIDCVKVKQPVNLELLKKHFPDAYDISKEDLETKNDIFKRSNKQQVFRGKFELEFLKKIVDSLKLKNKKEEYFTVKYKCVKVDVNVNTLSTLSEYADTPDLLIEFLGKHRSEQ